MRDTLRRSESGQGGRARRGDAGQQRRSSSLFTVIFTRLLGANGYGTLAALISAFLILLVAGQSVQMAAAREAALDRLGHPEAVRATLRAWTQRLLVALVVVTRALGALPDADRRGGRGRRGAVGAAAILPTGVLWMLLSLQRGALQGLRAYAPVGTSIVAEGVGRLAVRAGAVRVRARRHRRDARHAARLRARRRRARGRAAQAASARSSGPTRGVRSLRGLVGDGWVPIVGLILLAALQNIDVIVAKHRLGADAAGSYAAAAVAAKSVVWVAIGIGLHLLPEATRRSARRARPAAGAAARARDPRRDRARPRC